ncbi:MAG: SDR family oxidoreductase [Propionibacteriaceae bacterium]|nr:SDR family oxidoreductase [Propionibacteriaceae bacterium]
MIDFGLQQEVALVTGASSGIGQAVALALGRAGAAVGCAARSATRAAQTADLIEAAGGRALAIAWDVTVPEQAAEAVGAVEQAFGPLSLAVNNAGIGAGTPALDLTPAQWQEVLDTNVNGVFFSCQAEGRAMRRHGRGAIVNIASISATIANRNLTQVQYNASKAAVVHLTRSLAVEWAPLGIRVNAVSPGYTLTPMNRRPEVADLVEEFAETTPLGRLAEPEEIAARCCSSWDRRRATSPASTCSSTAATAAGRPPHRYRRPFTVPVGHLAIPGRFRPGTARTSGSRRAP